MKKLKSGVVAGIARNHHSGPLSRDPSGNTFAKTDRDPADQLGVRILRGPENQLFAALRQQIQQARLRLGGFHHHFDDMFEHRFQIKRVADGLADPVQHIRFASFLA